MRRGVPPLLALILGAGLALAQTPNVFRVTRDESTMVLTNRAFASEGARTLGNLRSCEEGVLTSVMYGPPDEVEMVIDDETRLRSSLAIIRRPAESEEGEGQETIEMLDGTATFADRPPCLESFEPAETQRVRLEQGRTDVLGRRFFLDRETDVATMQGPIVLNRASDEESDALQATAEGLEYDLGTQRSTLTGSVRVESGDRVSEAERLELDEEAGLATLTGNPARSRQGEDRIEGETLLYYLDSNDIVVIGGVKGTLEVDLE
jgi:lipopolysaccharide export system protein LptA